MKIWSRCPKQPKKPRRFLNLAGWNVIADRRIYFRSQWELKYAQALQLMKEQKLIADWEHEPQTFWFESIKRGCRSYLPDFKVTRLDGTHYWVEVKGYMDARSKTKIKRFNKYYPAEELIVADKQYFTNAQCSQGGKYGKKN